MNYRILSLLLSITILSHLLLNRIEEIQKQNGNDSKKPVKKVHKEPEQEVVKEDLVKYIENFENDLDIDNELDYDLDMQYKYRDDSLNIDLPKLPGPNNKPIDGEVSENPLLNFDNQTKSNVIYSEPSAAQGYRTIKSDMYHYKNEKIINGGFIDKKTHLKPFDGADVGYAAI